MEALRFLRHFQRSNYEGTMRASIPIEVQREMEILLQYYITYQLERSLNTPSFIRQIRNK